MKQRHAQAYVDRVLKRHGARTRTKVRIRRAAGYGWAARFDPEHNEIDAIIGDKVPEAEQRALLVHETSHKVARLVDRSGTYKGEHDARFFAVEKSLHERAGTKPTTAVRVEELSGYRPPKEWKRASRKGEWYAAEHEPKQVRWIAKCKACKCVTSTLASNVNRGNEKLGSMFRDQTGESGSYGGFAIRCRCCGKARKAEPIKGTYNPRVECNAKCMASKGNVCECSCGGKNHGASWNT